MNSKVARHMEICKALNALYERKNHDYGDSFHVTFLRGAPGRFSLASDLNKSL